MQEKHFSITLRKTFEKFHLTSSQVAKNVNYDESYISKWINGRALPSETNVEKIVNLIVEMVYESIKQYSENEYYYEYGEQSINDVLCRLRKELETAYQLDKINLQKETVKKNIDGHVNYKACANIEEVVNKIRKEFYEKGDNFEIIEMIDVFSINHESRLLLAGIKDGKFFLNEEACIKLRMIIDFTKINDYIYDTIFMVHMLTSYSRIEFEIYSSPKAGGRVISLLKNHRSLSAYILEKNEVLALVEDENYNNNSNIYKKLDRYCTQETLVFQHIDIVDLLQNHLYVQSLLSYKLDWLIGHFTEQLIPDSVFTAIIEKEQLFFSNEEVEEINQINTIRYNVYTYIGTRLLIYRTAIINFILTGEVDFYGKKIILGLQERILCIEYVITLLQKENVQMKIIQEDLSADFRNITNPCLFISNEISYLRLNNQIYRRNLMLVKDKSVWLILKEFYSQVWESDSICGRIDENKILEQLNEYLNKLKLFRTQ